MICNFTFLLSSWYDWNTVETFNIISGISGWWTAVVQWNLFYSPQEGIEPGKLDQQARA